MRLKLETYFLHNNALTNPDVSTEAVHMISFS